MTGDLAIGGSPYPRVARKATKAATSPSRLLPILSIRPHQIELVADHQTGTVSARGDNLIGGTVQRASYLGDAVDCQVQVEGSDVILRVAIPVTLAAGLRQGETVRLAVAPSACIPLAESEE